ncbi:MAG: cobalamin-independent methionine synthase II family protein [Bradyrhizobiaceae bacterium]|nr:cobalamin-independent methionine synthase II family protein [Bradyrhizobiaceae bacterium]
MSAQRSIDRILTTHVGSLVRPPELVSFMRAKLQGEPLDERAFSDCVERSISQVVRRQVDAGIDIVSDGEYGKSNWYRYVLDRLGGFEHRAMPGEKPKPNPSSGNDFERFRDFYLEHNKTQQSSGSDGRWIVTGPIIYHGHAAVQRDIDTLKKAIAGAGAYAGFLPVVAPASVLSDLKDEYYGDEEKLSFALADALRNEYRMIADAGLIVQIDDAWLAAKYDRMVPPGTLADYRKWAEIKIAALNHALRGIPEEQTRYHVCWGSWNGPHTTDVPLEDIVDLLLQVRVGGYSIEAANPRHEHEWRVWETVELPAGKVLVPGLISHATNIVEHPKLVAERIVRFARLVGRENVIASSDCGFAQGVFYQRVHPSIMWAKLEALAEGARLASAELWGKTNVRMPA